MQENPIYKFLKENNLTTKDENSFLKEYSDPNKAKELYGFLKTNNLTTKDEVSFYDTYFKKKNLGGVVSSPTGSQSVSKSFISSLPEQKSIYAPTQKLASESTTVVAPKKAKLISEANKRGDQITKEAIENSNNLYLENENKGVYKFTKDSPSIQQNKKSLEEQVSGGALQVVKSPKTGKYVLAHNAGIFKSFSNAWDNVLAKQADDKYVAGLSTEDKIKHYEVKDALNKDKYLEEAPSGFSGSLGRLLGENAEPLIKLAAMANIGGKAAQAAGATAQTVANAQKFGSFLAFATDAGYSGYANNTERVYKSLRKQDPNGDPVEQMRKAENAGLIGEASGIGMAAGMTGIFKNLKGAAETINTKPFVSALETMAKHTSKEAGVQGSIAALNSIVSDLGAKSQGMDIGFGDIVENALESGKQMAQFVGVTGLAMGTLTGLMKVPGYVKAQAKGLVSELPREEVKAVYQGAEANGIVPEGTADKVINSLNQYDKAKEKLPEGLTEDKKASLTGIQERIDKLEESKKKLAPQYHDRVDNTIKSLKDRSIKILESKDPLAEEVDNIIGVKGSEEIAGEPAFTEEGEITEEVKPSKLTITEEIPEITVEGTRNGYEVIAGNEANSIGDIRQEAAERRSNGEKFYIKETVKDGKKIFTLVDTTVFDEFGRPGFKSASVTVPENARLSSEALMGKMKDALGVSDKTSLQELNKITSKMKEAEVEATPTEVKVTEEVKDLSKFSEAELEKRLLEIEDSASDTPERAEANKIDKELEKREWRKVFDSPLDKVAEVADELIKKNEEQPNGFSSYIESWDARRLKLIADKYSKENVKNLTDSEIIKDYKDTMFGNPTSWYSDGLKLRESVKEAQNRGIDVFKELSKEFVKDGYSEQDAMDMAKRKLEPILKDLKQSSEKPLKLEQKPTEVKAEVEPAEAKPVEQKVTVELLSSKEPPQKEGETIVTLSGKTEKERVESIDRRKRETKVSDKVVAENDLIQDAEAYFKKDGRYKNSSEGRNELNNLRIKARELGLEIDTDRDAVTRRGKSGRPTKVRYNNKADGEAVVDPNGRTITERSREVQDAFEELTDAGIFLDVQTELGKRMSASQIDAAIKDILDGIPSKRAETYLNALEKAIAEDAFPLYDKALGDIAPRLDEIRAQLGVEREVIGEPMDEAALNKFLGEEAELTPEEEQILLDNVENLLYEYETTEEGPQREVQPIEARAEEGVSGKAEPVAEAKEAGAAPKPVKEVYDEFSSKKSELAKKKIINDNFDTIVEDLIKNKKIERIC